MLISVVIPCYNVAPFIDRCLASVTAQTWPSLEIICVNNQSTDDTLQKLVDWQNRFPAIVLLDEPSPGASVARNTGLRHAKGEYIQFLDADDYLLPEKLAHQVALLEKESFPDLLVAPYDRVREGSDEKTRIPTESDPLLGLLRSRLGCTCSNLWKKQMLSDAGAWNETLKSSQEYDLMFRMIRQGARVAFSSIPETVVVVRGESISTKAPAANWGRYLSLRIAIMRFIRESGTEMKQRYLQAFFNAIRMAAPYERELAQQAFDEFIPRGFSPLPDEVNSASYCRLYRLFGFQFTEKLRRWLS